MNYESVIGLEVHAQLSTKSKIFCGCSTVYGASSNTQVCPICCGMPGVLPVLNKLAVEYAMKSAIAFGGKIANTCRFARKNYFYPDLPKGYQISQYDEPLSKGGYINITVDGQIKSIGITRVHLEEDAGKSFHPEGGNIDYSLVDMNRCGVPLIEIVSEPDIRSPEEAYLYLTKLKQILEYLEICDADMEKGNLRCDANVSVRPVGSTTFGTKVEVKNLNSFKYVQRALEATIKRLIKTMESGEKVEQATLLWDEKTQDVYLMRTKESSHDYRYFPEPDLVPLEINEEWINQIRQNLPELPDEKRKRFIEQYNIPAYDVEVLTITKELANYYEDTVKLYNNPKQVSNFIMGEVMRVIKQNDYSLKDFKVTPSHLAEMFTLIDNGTISGKIAKEVFNEMVESGKMPKTIVSEKGLVQITDTSEVEKIIDEVLANNQKQLEQYRSGKSAVFGYFVGQIMKATKGKANPQIVNEILKKKLDG